MVLPAVSPAPGAERVAIERAYDSTFHAFISEHGQPDYIYVADRFTVQLTYLDADRLVLFERPGLDARSEATITEGIPTGLFRMLPPADQASVLAHRAATRPTQP